MLGAVCVVGVCGDKIHLAQSSSIPGTGGDQGRGQLGHQCCLLWGSLELLFPDQLELSGSVWDECPSLSAGARQRCPCGMGTLQDQSLPLCTPVPGSAGVSEETMVGFGWSVLALGALLALQ